MMYVVVEELIPEASQGAHSNINTIGFAIGFSLMMILDVVLGWLPSGVRGGTFDKSSYKAYQHIERIENFQEEYNKK